MQQKSENSAKSKKWYWTTPDKNSVTPAQRLMLPLTFLCLVALTILALTMTGYSQTVIKQQGDLTPAQLRQLLRASLDREDILVKQRDAALAHIKTLETQLDDFATSGTLDAKAIENLEAQKELLQTEIKEARAALASIRVSLTEERAAATSLKSALTRAENEVERQKARVKAANRRTLWAVVGGVLVGVFSAIAID